jgi:hypothetical protein
MKDSNIVYLFIIASATISTIIGYGIVTLIMHFR